jgi:hypothetical protein
MDNIAHAALPSSEAPVPTDLLASLLMEQTALSAARAERYRLPLKIFGVMAVTTLLTFATLTTAYQMLFSHQVFA